MHVDSWSQYESVLLPISITYENSQSTCLLADGSTIYDSTFATEISGSRSYQSFVSVGTDQSKLTVSATITATNVVACSFLVYLRAKINVWLRLFRINMKTSMSYQLVFIKQVH